MFQEIAGQARNDEGMAKCIEQNALRAYLFSVISLGNCFLVRFAALLGETLESTQFPMT